MMHQEQVILIDSAVQNVDLKGENIRLAAAIQLNGKINIDRLLADRPHNASISQTASPIRIGVDEAGRGPLLGCVNVAAIILPNAWSGLIENQPLSGTPLARLTDSKKLSEKHRDRLYPEVQHYAIGYVVAEVPAAVIDQINILQATMLGMRLCTETLLENLAQYASHSLAPSIQDVATFDVSAVDAVSIEVLVDGNRCPTLDYVKLKKLGIKKTSIDCQAWVKGDARYTSIAAASILAKVSRDQAMYMMDAHYPAYGIAKHKGYPTTAHIQAIKNYGVLPEHRRSFRPIKEAIATP